MSAWEVSPPKGPHVRAYYVQRYRPAGGVEFYKVAGSFRGRRFKTHRAAVEFAEMLNFKAKRAEHS